MITPGDPSSQTSYDPLATQFMTGGQMGYMPQAQYLSSPEYGAFRSMPGPQAGGMPTQRPSLWQSLMIASRGNAMGMLPDYSMSNYMMGADQSLYQTMARRRVQDAGSSFGAVAGNMGVNAVMSGAATVLGGPIAGLATSAMLPDLGAP